MGCNVVSCHMCLFVCLCMQCDDVSGQDLHFTGLKECEVRVLGPPSTIHLTNLSHCTYVRMCVCTPVLLIRLHVLCMSISHVITVCVVCSTVIQWMMSLPRTQPWDEREGGWCLVHAHMSALPVFHLENYPRLGGGRGASGGTWILKG